MSVRYYMQSQGFHHGFFIVMLYVDVDVEEGVLEGSNISGTHLIGFILMFLTSIRVFQKVLTCVGPITMDYL